MGHHLLSNKYIVLDISELKGKLLPVGMMIALDYVWDQVKADRTKRKMVFIDEIWKLIGGAANKQAAFAKRPLPNLFHPILLSLQTARNFLTRQIRGRFCKSETFFIAA